MVAWDRYSVSSRACCREARQKGRRAERSTSGPALRAHSFLCSRLVALRDGSEDLRVLWRGDYTILSRRCIFDGPLLMLSSLLRVVSFIPSVFPRSISGSTSFKRRKLLETTLSQSTSHGISCEYSIFLPRFNRSAFATSTDRDTFLAFSPTSATLPRAFST